MSAFQGFALVIGGLFVLVGLMFRGAMVFAMRRSNYDRISYMATWVVVSPALFIGLVLLWFAVVGIGMR